MKKNFLLFLVVFMAIQFNALAERINIPGLNIPGLIISEVRPDNETTAYVELTNVGDSAIDLSSFVLYSVFYNTRINEVSDSIINLRMTNPENSNTVGKVYLKGMLQPGESYVVSSVWDANDARGSGNPRHNTALAEIGNQFVYKAEPTNTNGWINKPEWQCFGKDSVGDPHWWGTELELLYAQSSAGYLLKWFFETDLGTVDSTFIDNFNFFYEPNSVGSKGTEIRSIAGIEDAMTTSVMVRKAAVKKGNLKWDQSRGTDALTSEWLVIPKNNSRHDAFTSVGVHGDYDLDYTVKDPATIILNEQAKTISVPWQLTRGDSLSHYFNLGKGMSWDYNLNASFEDTASFIARPGDMFTFYAVGNQLQKVDYTLQVREPEPDVALVFPKRRLVLTENLVLNEVTGLMDTVITRSWSNFVYGVVEGEQIDTIYNVPFATRTDSLLKYLDKPAKANLEFVFVDGLNRIDVMHGDKLKVTSENGTEKEYFVSVLDYIPSNNALLSTVTWPDIDKDLYPRWNMGDTLTDFTPLKTEYIIQLRSDAKQIPAFQFKPQNFKSRIEVKNAEDIDGTLAQRTTSVTVYAESDTTMLTYNFQFVKQGPVQPNEAEPFFSEFMKKGHTQGYAVEVYNPGTVELDLSRYCFLRGAAGQTWQEAVETVVAGDTPGTFGTPELKIYQTHYFPSKRWIADGSIADWNAIPNEENPYVGKGFLRDDNQTDPYVKGGDVWIAGVATRAPGTSSYQDKIKLESDFLFKGSTADNTYYAWDSTAIYQQSNVAWTYNYVYLLKCINDSILEGTKDVRDASAYELIDRFEAIGDSVAGVKLTGTMALVRKPHITNGTLERIGGGSETAESSEWIIDTSNPTDNLGIHVMDPITNYASTVTSVKFVVTPGYRGDNLSITGNIADYTPTTIALLLDKAEASATFVFMRGATELTANQSLAEGDMLEVTSGNGKSTTMYKLINAPLDGNTSLTAKAGSGLTVVGDKVTGVTFGMTLKEAMMNLEVANTSILNVLDANTGALQPLVVHNLDTVVMDVMVSKNVKLQVVAENYDKAIYTFDFSLASDQAVLGSNILKIDQAKRQLLELPIGSTPTSFLSMVFANEGATIRILDRAGFERTNGLMNVDDEIEVTAPDGIAKSIYGIAVAGHYTTIKGGAESATKVVLYPMPVTYVLNIQGFDLASIQVFTLSGTMIISQTSSSNSVDVSGLPKGVYIIKMKDVNGVVAVDKFLKK